MSCASATDRIRARRGLTLLEMLLAIAITMAFLTGVIWAFIEILRSNDRAQAKLEAAANARHALETMTIEFKQARFGPAGTNYFAGRSLVASHGDRKDNDLDGQVDEEGVGGHDDDGDWLLANDDRHAAITGELSERPEGVGLLDLGDGHIDEDNVFDLADVVFDTYKLPTDPPGNRRVRFRIDTFRGEPNVLMREITYNPGAPDESATSSPIAFNCLSFSCLYWDQNQAVTTSTDYPSRYWVKWNWNAQAVPAGQMEVPVSVYLLVTIYAGTQPLSSLPANAELDTVVLCTVANVEAVLSSPEYALARNVLPMWGGGTGGRRSSAAGLTRGLDLRKPAGSTEQRR